MDIEVGVSGTEDWDCSRTWYHGSQEKLARLCVGSSITQNRDIAQAFSHRPSVLSISNDGTIKHNGTVPGYLCIVSEEVEAGAVYVHPHLANVNRWEWLTKRELRLELVEPTQVREKEKLTEKDVIRLRHKQKKKGMKSFVECPSDETE